MPVVQWSHSSGAPADVLQFKGPLARVKVGRHIPHPHRPLEERTQWLRDIRSKPEVEALVDTGAFVSCIDSDFADLSGLQIVDTGEVTVHGVGGEAQACVYMGLIFVSRSPDIHFNGRLYGIKDLGKNSSPVIIGRDFLKRGLLVYSGFTGQFSFAM